MFSELGGMSRVRIRSVFRRLFAPNRVSISSKVRLGYAYPTSGSKFRQLTCISLAGRGDVTQIVAEIYKNEIKRVDIKYIA